MALILSGDTGPSFVQSAAMPTGSVLQVIQGTYATEVGSSTNTFIDTGLTATITPKSATSKILILVSHPENYKNGGNANNDIGFRIVKNGSSLVQFNNDLGYTGTTINSYFSASYTYLDSPASTSALTYKTQFCSKNSNAAAVFVNISSMASTITLIEIAA